MNLKHQGGKSKWTSRFFITQISISIVQNGPLTLALYLLMRQRSMTYSMLVPLALLKQPLPVNTSTVIDPWKCALVCGVKMLAADCLNPVSGQVELPQIARIYPAHLYQCSVESLSGEFVQVDISNFWCSSKLAWSPFCFVDSNPHSVCISVTSRGTQPCCISSKASHKLHQIVYFPQCILVHSVNSI